MADTVTKTVFVKGMFCTNCEKRIRERVMELPGVDAVDIKYTKENAVITFDNSKISIENIIEEIDKLGYKASITNNSYVQIASFLIILIAVYIIAKHLGWLQIFNLFPEIETSFSLGMLFVIGLLTSVHCIAMCGGINLTQSTMAAEKNSSLIYSNIAYNSGRVISYTVIGGIVGAAGSVISFNGALRGVVSIVVGLIMIMTALTMLGVFRPFRRIKLRLPAGIYKRLSGNRRRRSSFFIGLINGFMPCGPLQSMQIYALSAGSALMGTLSMFVFSLGTVPLMLGFGMLSGRLNKKHSRYMLTVSALIIFVMGINMTGNGFSLSGINVISPRETMSLQVARMEDGKQYVTTEIDYGSYTPIRVKQGIPVEWTIYVPDGVLNGCNNELLIPAYDVDFKLSEGYNTLAFIPDKTGNIPYSCWMGMIKSNIEVVE